MRSVSPVLPAWARAADAVMAALAAIGVIVAWSGGFHARLGQWQLNVTSPLRLIVWAALVAGVRSAFARTPSVYDHVTSRVAAWARADALRAALLVVAGTRPATLAVGYLAVALFGYAPNARPFHEFDSELLNLPLRWDAGWYLQIAANGYEFLRNAGPDLQQNVVFFPAYPLSVRAAAMLFGNGMPAYVGAAVAVSLAFFVIALVYLHEMAAADLPADSAVTALWLLAAFPFALFYGAIYSESLYLAAALGAFYHLRKGELTAASAWGLTAGLARPNGFLLTIPLALAQIRSARLQPSGDNLREWLAIAMPIVGVAGYSAFIWQLTGHPFTWLAGHAAWGRHYQGLSTLVVDRYDFIAHAGFATYASQRPYDLLNALGVVFVLASVWPVARRFGLAFAAFILVNVLPPLATGGLMSAGRFASVLFPSFLWLAAVMPARHRAAWIATFASLQALNAALFYTWRPLY